MNVDRILEALNHREVDYLLIGGINFLLRHKPLLTYDVDVWVRDDAANLASLNRALKALGAGWGKTEKTWGVVPDDPSWLRQQGVFCLTTDQGALDIFREVLGLEGRYDECKREAGKEFTASGVAYLGLSDRHMLLAEQALDPGNQRTDRIETLKEAIAKRAGSQ